MEAQLALLAFFAVVIVVPLLTALTSMGNGDAGETLDTGKSFLTSERERRLWLWLCVVLLAIYGSMAQSPQLSALLREHDLLRFGGPAAIILAGTLFAIHLAKRRSGINEIGVAIGITAAYLMVLLRIESWEERTHLFEYGVVAVLIYNALVERRRNNRTIPVPAIWAVVATALLGLVDETIQSFLPNRVYDLRDVGFNALAGFMAITSTLVLGLARRLAPRWFRSSGRAHRV